MVFSIHYYKSIIKTPWRRWLRGVCALLACCSLIGVVYANGIEIRKAALVLTDEGYALNADFNISLGPSLEEVVSRGIPLYFVVDFSLTRPRWYWRDEPILTRTLSYRLTYHALTRQYRLSTGGALHQNFAQLNEALGVLSRLREWLITERAHDKSLLKAGETYAASLSLRLDSTQLPKPFQVNFIGNRDWAISEEVRRWNFTAKGVVERDDK